MIDDRRGAFRIFWRGDMLWQTPGESCPDSLVSDTSPGPHGSHSPATTRVKQTSTREIHFVRRSDMHLFVKQFRFRSIVDRIRRYLQGDPAEKEFRLAQRLPEVGVATANPVALGRPWAGSRCSHSLLWTEAIPSSTTIQAFVERGVERGDLAPSQRRALIQKLAELVAALHEAGFEHPDLHERNILVQQDQDGAFRLYLVDLQEMKVHSRIRWTSAIRDLRRLGRYFSIRTSRSDRLRFFRDYARRRGYSKEQTRKLARDVERATLQTRAAFWRRRDARSMPRQSGVKRHVRGLVSALASAGVPDEWIQTCLSNPDALLSGTKQRPVPVPNSTRVYQAEIPELLPDRPLIVKHYRFNPWREWVAGIGRDDPATRAFRNALSLGLREIRTPPPLLLLHRRKWGMLRSAHLATPIVPDAVPITAYLAQVLAQCGPVDRRRIVRGSVDTAARLLRKMHERGVTHHDLKGSNVLAARTSDTARPILWLIDLDGVRTWLRVPDRERVQNLGRLFVDFVGNPSITRADRLRFLRTYLGARAFHGGRWRAVWRRVEHWVNQKVAKQRRQMHGDNRKA